MSKNNESKKRKTYAKDFKEQIVKLYLNGKRKCDILKEYGMSPSVLDRWINQYTGTGSFEEKDNRSIEEQKIIELEKENKHLRMENDILKQAALIIGRR